MKERRKDETAQEKIGWYHRHWNGMGLDREVTKTYSLEAWNEQCIKDPLLNKALQPPKAKRQKTNNQATGQTVVLNKTQSVPAAEAPQEEAKEEEKA